LVYKGRKRKDIIVLGIESSCDETSVAVVKNGREVLSNVIDTQIKIHEQFGGVVPEIASRKNAPTLMERRHISQENTMLTAT
jgi:N6-L-threonylcarbamoyladenine synthase